MYYIVYGLFYVLSLLPWRVLYLLSDFFYLIVYYIVGYRKEVVMNNLSIAFPDKTLAERKKIAKEFYQQFTDTFIEVFKLISISEKELNKRFTADYSVINNIHSSGKNVQLLVGHFFNWEFANLAYSNNLLYKFLGVYMPIQNKVFDKIFYNYRKKFGTVLIPATEFKKNFSAYSKEQYCLALVGDQNPGGPENAYWTSFFGRMTPFVKGPERSAKFDNTAVVLCNFYKIKRGYYRSDLKLLSEEPKTLPHGEITKQLAAFIEETVRQHPSGYLWSHKRWKYQFDEGKHSNLVV